CQRRAIEQRDAMHLSLVEALAEVERATAECAKKPPRVADIETLALQRGDMLAARAIAFACAQRLELAGLEREVGPGREPRDRGHLSRPRRARCGTSASTGCPRPSSAGATTSA